MATILAGSEPLQCTGDLVIERLEDSDSNTTVRSLPLLGRWLR